MPLSSSALGKGRPYPDRPQSLSITPRLPLTEIHCHHIFPIWPMKSFRPCRQRYRFSWPPRPRPITPPLVVGGGGAERRNSSNSLSDPTLTAELFSFFSMTLAKEKEETNPLQESCLFHRCRRLLLFLLCLRFLQIFRQRKGSRRGGRKYLGGGEGRGEGRGSYPPL